MSIQPVCSHDISVLISCDTMSYPFNKGKIDALNFLWMLFEIRGEEEATNNEQVKRSTLDFVPFLHLNCYNIS